MKKEKVIETLESPILRPIGWIQGIFILAFIASPFCWIWLSWDVAWKLGLTGLIGTIIFYWIYKITKLAIKAVVDEHYKK